MRILYIVDFFHPHVGGAPTFFNNLAESVAKMGHKVTVVTIHANGTKNLENYKGMKIHRFGRTREQFIFGAIKFLMKSKEKFDVIHTSTYSAMIPSYTFRMSRKIPEVLSVHEVWSLKEWTEFTKTKGPFYFLEERLLFSLPFDVYVSPSLHTKGDLEKIGVKSSKIKIIPHGIDDKLFRPGLKKSRNKIRAKYAIGKNEIVGCFVGKATVFKGVNYLLDAIKSIPQSTDMKFVFVLSRLHEKGYRKFMEKVKKSENLRSRIVVIEASANHEFVSKIVAASDFLVMPSLTEGFGFAVAEAASMGIPAIVTKGTSLTEVVENGKNAIFVRPRSSADIARAIKSLVKSKKLRSKLSRGKKFAVWRSVAREYVKVYEDVIRRHKEAGR